MRMDLPWLKLALSSVAGTVCIVHFAAQYSLFESYFATFFVLFAIQTILGAVWKVVLWPKLFSPLRHLPHPSGGSFFNGQFKRIVGEPTGVPQQEWINTIPNDGLIYYTSLLNVERLLLTSPQALNEVLTTKSYEFIKPSFLRHGLGRILGIGLILAEGDEHKKQRKNLMPAFAFRHVKDLYPIFWNKSQQLVNALMAVARENDNEIAETEKDAVIVEIGGWSSRAALDIIGVAGLGKDFNAINDPHNELNATYQKVFQPSRQQQTIALLGLFLPHWFLHALPIAHNNNVIEATKTIKRVCRQLIHQKQEKLDNKEKRVDVDILSVALESGGFSEEELVNQMMTFLAAGHETTATTMTWAMYLLCKYPEVQSRLREEVRANLPPVNDKSASVTSEHLDKLPYLHAVCNETLRLYAPVPGTLREAAHDTTILNHHVPAGIKIIVSVWGVNTSTALWGADAADFKPERWLGPGRTNTGGATSNYAFLTFLHGPRSCIGQAFAKAEFACLLAAAIGRFEWELAEPDKKIEIKGGITARPKGGLNLKMRPLDGW